MIEAMLLTRYNVRSILPSLRDGVRQYRFIYWTLYRINLKVCDLSHQTELEQGQ